MGETVIIEVPTWLVETLAWMFVTWVTLSAISSILGFLTARLNRKIAALSKAGRGEA